MFYLVAGAREASSVVVSDRSVVSQNTTLYRVSCSTAIGRAFYVEPIKRGLVAIRPGHTILWNLMVKLSFTCYV